MLLAGRISDHTMQKQQTPKKHASAQGATNKSSHLIWSRNSGGSLRFPFAFPQNPSPRSHTHEDLQSAQRPSLSHKRPAAGRGSSPETGRVFSQTHPLARGPRSNAFSLAGSLGRLPKSALGWFGADFRDGSRHPECKEAKHGNKHSKKQRPKSWPNSSGLHFRGRSRREISNLSG